MPQLAVVPLISRRGFVRGAKETTWGAPAAATFDLPTHTRDLRGDLTKVSPDLGLNTRSRDFLIVNGRRWAAGPLGGPAFGTSFGIPLMGTLGADAVTTNPAAPTGGAAVGSTTGGTLTAATYWYRVSAVSGVGETTPVAEFSGVVSSGSTGSVAVSWNEVPGSIGYNVYGRTTGTELKLLSSTAPVFVGAGTGTQVTVPGGVTTFTDTGAITPAGAIPGANTFGNRHLFTVANLLPSYTFEVNRGGFGSSEQFAGCIFGQLDLAARFDQNDGLLEWTGQILGAFPAPPIAATTFVKPTDKPAVAAKCSAAYAGASWAKVMEFTASVNNTGQPIKVANSTLDINNAIATALEAHGTCRVVFDAFAGAIAEYSDWSANNGRRLAFTFPFEDTAGFELILPSAIISNWQFRDSGPQYVEASFDWRVQDAAANLQAALVNGQAAAY